jgi:hypothetical protein
VSEVVQDFCWKAPALQIDSLGRPSPGSQRVPAS